MKRIDLNAAYTEYNYFDQSIIPIYEIVKNKAVNNYLRLSLARQFNRADLPEEFVEGIVNECLEVSMITTSALEFEKKVHDILIRSGVFTKYTDIAKSDAKSVYEKIKQYLVGSSVLDLGCGTGRIAELISLQGYQVALADVYKNDYVKAYLPNLPFYLIEQEKSLPIPNASFDNVLMLVMLHHSANPVSILKEVGRIINSSGRVLIIETVFGINRISKNSFSDLTDGFTQLSHEEQRLATMFLDYFGNRIAWYFTTKTSSLVPVPFNFNKPENWRNIFTELGYKIEEEKFLGVDQNKGVCHSFFVLEKLASTIK